MALSQYSRAIAVFSSREAAGQAFDKLILSGFPLAKLFLGKRMFINKVLENRQLKFV